MLQYQNRIGYSLQQYQHLLGCPYRLVNLLRFPILYQLAGKVELNTIRAYRC